MQDHELKGCAIAIMIYETARQNPDKLPFIACQINNALLETTLQICSGLDIDDVTRAIQNARGSAGAADQKAE